MSDIQRGAAAIEAYFEQYMPDMVRSELAQRLAAACADGDAADIEQALTDVEEAIWQISLGHVADAAAKQLGVDADTIRDEWDGEDHMALVDIIIAESRRTAG